jgi:hypothetical protein
VLLAAAWLGMLALAAVRADAVILPATTIDGPSEEIVGFGGVAMAEDGTGGVVYMKRVEGVAHVFVSRFVGGSWQPPVRVDHEEPFGASWPRIAAGNGGQLVVVWATAFATEGGRPVDELMGATLGQGSSQFGPAILIDANIKSGIGASPDLKMSTDGQAVVVYRVVREPVEREQLGIPLLRPEDVIEDVRMARYNGERWTKMGVINRNPGVSMRPPTEANAPKVAIGPTGNGVVVWQEPNIDGVARIWARRFFGTALNYVLPVTAETLNRVPIALDADAPSVSLSRLGEAEVAYRQAGGAGSPLPSARIFLNTLPDGESASGAEFAGAGIVDGEGAAHAAGAIGPPSIDSDENNELRLLYDAGGQPRVVEGTDLGRIGALGLGPPFAGSELASASVMNPVGGGVSAWPSIDVQHRPAVAVREDFSSGAVQTALEAGGAGGEIGELAVASSGLGDGLIGFRQGQIGDAAIVVVRATAPPQQLLISAPKGWVKPRGIAIHWTAAPSANPPLSYTVVLDGRRLPTPPGALSMVLSPRGLGQGRHSLQVLATDSVGQSTLTPVTPLQVDGVPPQATLRLGGGGRILRVLVSDGGSGVNRRSVRISFGDGSQANGRASASHRYSREGVYTVTVTARDRLGNTLVAHRLVSAR